MTDKYRILVTGTSSGFGKLTAETLARAGHRVFAGMRDPNGKNSATRDELAALKLENGGSLEVVDLDVVNDASVNAAVAHVESRAGGIDVLVNNAGIAGAGVIESFTVEQARAMYEVNVFGVHRMNRAVLPIMRRGNRGLIVHVTSTIGRLIMPFLGIYVSTKFALEALAEAYHYELAPSGIEAIIVEPGSYPTKIGNNMLTPADPEREKAHPALQPMLQGLMGMLSNMAAMPNAPNPQDVADAISRLVAQAPGTRPLRTIVDTQMGPMVEQINRLEQDLQTQALISMGMGALISNKTEKAN